MVPPGAVSFAEAFRTWLKIGCLSFGGPAGQVFVRQAQVRWTQAFSSGSWSILANSSPCSVSGISIEATSAVATQRVPSCTIAPRSISIRTTSSTKNGLPSDLARIRSRTRAGSELEVQADSICVHGDRPGAAALARAMREALTAAGVSVRSPAQSA